ncbi:MAG: DUF445 family protein [Gemmatimonadetes bacterium]|nr:DUF445 family protein [Gemmatimonadota bacterium]
MDRELIGAAAATILGGAFSGGITNAIAIWMLFRPHEPTGIWRFRIQGAIPKNKARLAKSIGKTVGEKLLTPADLAERLAAPPVRAAFDEAVGRAIRQLLEREHGSLRSQLGPAALAAVEQGIAQIAARLADRLVEYTHSPDFVTLIGRWLESLKRDLEGRPVGELLTPARREALAEQLDQWVGQIAESDGLERTIRSWIATQLAAFEADPRPLAARLPPGLLGPIEQALTDALPAALSRLGDLLADPEAKAAIRRALREAFDSAGKKLLFHERLVAKFVVNDKALARLVDGFEGEGFERLAATVTSAPMRERIATAVHQGLTSLLEEPLGSRLKRLPAPRRAALDSTLGDWLVGAVRADGMRASLKAALVKALDEAGETTWDRLLARMTPEQAAEVLRAALGRERRRAWIDQSLQTAGGALLDKPLGRPAEWLGQAQGDRLTAAITESAWGWVERQVPEVVGRLNIPEMVEQKIIGFPLPVMEDIIRRVIERELKLIVQLGWLLGAVVGLMTFGISRLVS